MTDPINKSDTESYEDRIFRLWQNGSIQPTGRTDKELQENHIFMMESYAARHKTK